MTILKDTLTKYWGYSSFLPFQEDIIHAILKKEDVIAVLPTGGGKSLCFQLPALLLDGVCLVISPLIALIQDQIQQLQEKNIKALSIASNADKNEIIRVFDNLDFGNYKFLYISPERLQSKFVQQKLQQIQISFIVIDEAHCISEWGHDFRPAYRKINHLKSLLPNTNFVAFTGTATKNVITDISQNLQLPSPKLFIETAVKKNIGLFVYEIEDKFLKLIQILQKLNAPAIVYTNTRNKTQEIAKVLNAHKIATSVYHGALTVNEKNEAFKSWMNEKTPIMVATNAFGMGINKPNVKAVIHFDIPNSIENYVQEIGRAGRNNQKAFAFLLYNATDILNQKFVIDNNLPTIEEIKLIHLKLYQYLQIAKGELPKIVYDFNVQHFSKVYNFNDKKVKFTLQVLANNFVIDLQNLQRDTSSITFNFTTNQIQNYIINNSYNKNFINSLLRTYSGLYEQKVKINEYHLATKNNLDISTVITFLQQLNTDGLLTYEQAKSGIQLRFLQPREDDKTIYKIEKNINFFLNQKNEKLKELIQFVTNKNTCKAKLIAKYFDENLLENCDTCINCISKSKKEKLNIEGKIISILKRENNVSSKNICNQINASELEILNTLQKLLVKEVISIDYQNNYYIIKK